MIKDRSPIFGCDNQEFRDLNKNGMLDIYEDKSQSIDDRVNDLISQMSIEEKAGSIFIDITKVTFEGSISSGFASFLPETVESINNLQMNLGRHNPPLTPSIRSGCRCASRQKVCIED